MPYAVAAAAVAAGGAVYSADKNAKSAKNAGTKTERPAWLEGSAQGALQKAETISNRGYEGYNPGQRVAGLSGNEQSAYGTAAGLSSKYQPLIDRASTQFSGEALNNYMNPYREQVLDVNARKINSQFDTQVGALNSKRGMMDAFGSDRGTLLEGQLNRARATALSDANTQGLSDAYDKGANLFLADRMGALQAANGGMAVDQAGINSQLQTGALDRGVRQSQADFDYGQFIEKRDWDVTNLQPLLDALSTASGATGGNATRTGGGASTAGQLAGLASTVAGSYLANYQGGSSFDKVGSGSAANGALSDAGFGTGWTPQPVAGLGG